MRVHHLSPTSVALLMFLIYLLSFQGQCLYLQRFLLVLLLSTQDTDSSKDVEKEEHIKILADLVASSDREAVTKDN